jgi:benzoyl-CoA reductase/2-hydroxyglutaryl-CoA dehydratase subunit BcrC/BadD/HgdB
MSKMDVLHVSPEIIRARYEDLIENHKKSGPEATRQIQHWLYNELKLTEEYVEKVVGIKINEDALRQWLSRERKRRRKKK